MRIVVTGADGFLGWHTRCVLRARGGHDVVALDRSAWSTPGALSDAVAGADAVLHLAGANRATPDELRDGNLALARELTAACDAADARPSVVYADSIQAGNGTPFGDGKQAAADHLAAWGAGTGASVFDARLPNLFGEHGRPHYNSVVATFCHELATGGTPVVHDDRVLALTHVHTAVDRMLELTARAGSGVVEFDATPTSVTSLLDQLITMHDVYATGDIPAIADPFTLALFNTYRSFTFPQHFPIRPPRREDERGGLTECVRAHGGQAQVFCSTSHPGVTRGEHFHLQKVERFLVLAGEAEIALRRLFDTSVVRFRVSGADPAMVDMPTMWVHSITNVGKGELMTLFWAHEVFDPSRPDTYPELVGRRPEPAAR